MKRILLMVALFAIVALVVCLAIGAWTSRESTTVPSPVESSLQKPLSPADEARKEEEKGDKCMAEAVALYRKAMECYQKAIDQGYQPAQYKLAFCYLGGELRIDADKGGELLKDSAEQGCASAQYQLGLYYLYDDGILKGTGMPPVFSVEGKNWLTKAAEQGHAKAQLKLALYCSKYSSYEHEAAGWLEKAANQGDAEAQYNYGKWLLEGKYDLKRDEHQAREYLKKSAAQGYRAAKEELDVMRTE